MASHVIHVEVLGKDGPALQRFYGDVFGWTLNTDNPGGYGMFDGGGKASGAASAPRTTAARGTSRSTSMRTMPRRRSAAWRSWAGAC